MPAINDLTPEEEQAFIEHGVQPSGPGREPTGELSQTPNPLPEPAAPTPPMNPHADRQPVARDEQGRFAPTQEPAQQPLDPNAPPVEQQPQPGAPPPGFVPHQALHESRAREQQARQMAQLAQTRMNALLAAQQPPAPEPLPDINSDPVGYVQALEQRIARFENERAQEQEHRQIDNALEQDEQMFLLQAPDYNEAAAHYVQSRASELLAFNTPQQAQQIMQNEARQMAQIAWQRGVPAAQMVYQMAQARGFRSGQPPQAAPTPFAPAPQAQQFQQPQPGFQPQFQQPQGGLTPQQRVAAVQQGQQATRTLSVGSGSAAPAQLNAEALLALSDEEFSEYIALGTKGASARFAAFAGR